MKAYIYGLVDPRDNQIHYVGHTVDMQGRLGGCLTGSVLLYIVSRYLHGR